MKKNMNIFLSIMLFVLPLSFPVSIHANDVLTDNDTIKTVVINEYQGLLDEIEECQKRAINYSLSSSLNDYEQLTLLIEQKEYFIDFLYQQKQLSIDELKEKNYTDEQIDAIKNFDGSDAMAVAASAYVYVSGATMANTTTKHGVRFSWSWMGTPALAGPAITDGIAVQWQSVNRAAQPVQTVAHSDTNAFVRYGSTRKDLSITTYVTQRAAEAKFCMAGADGSELSWASSGVFDIYVKLPTGTSTVIANTSYEFAYGHVTLIISPSISFSYKSIGIGISATSGTISTRKEWETVAPL